MREILFRGKRLDTGEWVEGFLLRTNRQNVLIATNVDEYGCGCCITIGTDNFEVDPSTVGQFTGLRDKNETRIFEGDVMAFFAYELFYMGVVSVIDGNSCILCKRAAPFLDYAIKHYVANVIGNICDNPELLEGGQA